MGCFASGADRPRAAVPAGRSLSNRRDCRWGSSGVDFVRIGDLGGNGRIERHVIGTTRAAKLANNDIYLSGTVTSGVVENHGNVFVIGQGSVSSLGVPPTMPGVLSSREGIDNHGTMTLLNSLVSSDSHFDNHAPSVIPAQAGFQSSRNRHGRSGCPPWRG
ncbi:MAG TPA: hypothetical protein DCY89_02700 [Gammaproteobacteria bacterium]|nr:hypothetical protein [Gammaproteobacteria bacterium]